MEASVNPWLSRFDGGLDESAIRQRATVEVEPLAGLSKLPVEAACKRLEGALERVFYPTHQCVSVLQRLIGMAHAHSSMTYADRKSFLGHVYGQKPPLPDFAFPICLTGLAGTGKSKLLEAYLRIQPPDQEVMIDAHHSPFPLQAAWLVTVEARISPHDVLRAIAGQDGKAFDLVASCRTRAFRNGVPMMLLDEFQFATGSSNANTRVSQMLMLLGRIGLPYAYAANFSLLKRLQKRPEEDRQRLLANPIIIVPDAPDSEDWVYTLAAQKAVSPEVLRFDPVADSHTLHRFTAGRKRAGAKLLLYAFRAEHGNGGIVDMAAIERAYRSVQFTTYRLEAEAIMTQNIQNRPVKGWEDLWCPLPLPKGTAAVFQVSAASAREERVAEAELRSAMTAAERAAADAIGKSLKKKAPKAGEVLKFKKTGKADSNELLVNASLYRDKL